MNPKILVADDDDRIRKMIRISLNASHYEVIESATIQETILKAAKDSPDLILLDLQFPDGNGITALREIRSWSETPVIVLSVLSSDPEKISLLDGGADENRLVWENFWQEFGSLLEIRLRIQDLLFLYPEIYT